jgi:glycosyltransferase involved in cell wall biosynthesis
MSASQPLVSIVTPSYNQAEYLEAALRSILAQDYPRLEILVADGASSDGSPEIIRRYAGRLAWWVSEPDRGQAEAINKGLRRAGGEIVAWLNSDDLYLPGAVSQAVGALQADPALGLVFGDALTIDGQGRPLNNLAFGDWGLAELLAFRIICQPAVFMRRAALEQAGTLDESYHYMLDHHLWLRIAALGPVKHIPAWLAAARHHPGAKNVSQAEGFARETARLLDWLQAHPALGPLARRDWRRVQGGAYRLSARYLLDGGKPAAALQWYAKALRARPGYALQHWHRMLYALLSLVGGARLAGWYYRLRPERLPDLSADPRLASWPGLRLERSPADAR